MREFYWVWGSFGAAYGSAGGVFRKVWDGIVGAAAVDSAGPGRLAASVLRGGDEGFERACDGYGRISCEWGGGIESSELPGHYLFAAIKPCVFVSKAEIAKWPVLGWMTTMSGTVYVNRGHGGSAVRRGRNGGCCGCRAAGGFLSRGDDLEWSALLTFHSGLLAQAMLERQPVTAAYVQYVLDEENDADVTVADDVCYWGDVSMW